MKKITIFYICLAVAWFILATASGIMAIMGVQVDAIVAFCPSILCSFLYLDKFVLTHRKEK
jgi:hypothetical protein